MKREVGAHAKRFFFRATGIEPYRLSARKDSTKENLSTFFRLRSWPMFHWVTVETSTFCNRKCLNCPVSAFPRDTKFMSERIFTKIIEDLGRIRFQGIIHLHWYNEPLADRTITEKIRVISKKVPRARIVINSNGDFLTSRLLRELALTSLNELYITQYDGEISRHILDILEKAEDWERQIVKVRAKSNFVGNRAGLLSQTVVNEPLLAGCNRPSNQLIINYKGDAVICCNDYLGKVTLGNVGKTSLLGIWKCEQFKSIRRLLTAKRRDRITLCKSCNFLGDIYDCRDLTSNEIRKFNEKVRLRNSKSRLVPVMLENRLDILRCHGWV
jgi:radical SAM protein with 4Fe4S-binding SPASM domain